MCPSRDMPSLCEAWSWLLQPLSGVPMHDLPPWAYWHARAMVLGWGVLLPLGVFIARFFKVWPGQDWPRQLDNKIWWHAHRGLQWSGVLAMTAGAALVWGHGAGVGIAARLHGVLGWVLCIAGWLQIASSLVRGTKGGPNESPTHGDHYDMTRWRVSFEVFHKALGWMAIAAAVSVIGLGLLVADAPRWMAVALCGWWLALGLLFAVLQGQGRCIDTYQAIWGPGEEHPGNRIAPIGWGVRRYTAAGWRARSRRQGSEL